ncbi:MAG TPA: molecular chaperone DnaK [Candidatus Paceibacterota bacterium]|nr:molecular chaperone DnaK [Candidatus Paceibacterota bacterium]
MSKILGIDLGTTNSAMAVTKGGDAEVLENKEGSRTTPSVVALNKSGERLVGTLAKRQAVSNPDNTIYAVKRLIGRKFKEDEIQEDKKTLSYDIRKSDQGGVEIKMGDRWYKPEEISARILQKMKRDAESKLGEEIKEAVITVPAYFDDSQRQATKQAGQIAGFKVRRILNEPTAAALAYGLNKKNDEQIVVFDFGGGTFDISILEVGDDTVEVKATGGDPHLGGEDFDRRILDYLISEYKKEEGIDLSKDRLAVQRLKEAAEKAKHELSTAKETEINLPYVTSGDDGPKHFVMKLTRAKLEDLVEDLIEKSLDLVKKTVTSDSPKGAGLKMSDIDEVILVGGQTRMPAIQKAVKSLFDKEPHKGINPDEVVATGAAIQAGIMQGDVKDVLLLDVTPLSLSIETMGGVATTMIPKNTTIPTEKKQTFSTAADNQSSVEVHVLQGERPMAADNKTLAKFILDGIPPAPRGVPQIEVTFDIDADGILNVSAKDKGTGKEQSVRVEASTSLSEEEVEELKKEAEEHAEEDKKKQKLIEARNKAESLVYTAEKSLREVGDKIDDDMKESIQDKIEEIEKVKEKDDIEEIKSKTEELSEALQNIGQSVYGASQGSGQVNASGDVNQPNTKGEVVDEQENESDNSNKKNNTSDDEDKDN